VDCVTFITTFWTATTGQAAASSQRLADLCRRWEDGVGVRRLQTYQHGWEYDGAGEYKGVIIDWFVNREQIARHAGEMVTRNYGSPTVAASRIEEELDANILTHKTEAGRLLGLSAPSRFSTSAHAAGKRDQDDLPQTGTSIPEPPLAGQTSSTPNQQPTSTPPHGISLGRVVLEGLSWFFRNVNPGGGAGGAGPKPTMVSGDPFRGGGGDPPASASVKCNDRIDILLTHDLLDPLSRVDLMKSRGLDSSREGRLTYARRHGIGGVPFSASWGDAMLKHLQRNR
jgi:hypothetical protein